LPLPQSLSSLSAGGGSGVAGGAALGTGLGVKAVALGASALLAAGVSTEIATRSHTGSGSARPAVRVAPGSERLASSRRVAEQSSARPAAGPAAAKALARRGAHRAGPRGKPRDTGSKARHRLATRVRQAKSAAPATATPTVIADQPGRRRAHPTAASRGGAHRHGGAATHGRTAREKHAADHLDRSGKPAAAGKPAVSPGPKAKHSTKEERAGANKMASGSVPPAPGPPSWSSARGAASPHTPGVPSASSRPADAGGPPENVSSGPPADPAAKASSKSKDAGPRKR
jgi:hypothetical protein